MRQEAVGTADGTTWETAFPDLQQALETIGAPDGDSNVCIASGVYRPAATIDLRDRVHIYGGFSGHEGRSADLDERDLGANPTVLDGSGLDHVLMCSAIRCEGPISVDGLTVRGGAAGRHGSPALSGGGLYNAIGTLDLSNIIFAENQALHQGGAVFNVAGAVNLLNVVLDGNSAGHEGGGIYNHAGKLTASNLVVAGNTSNQAGAGLYTLGATEISNVIFLGNRAPYGSAAVAGHRFILTNGIVWSNPAGQGGEIFANPSLARIAYSILNGSSGSGSYESIENTHADPLFVDASDPDGADDRWGTADDGLMVREASPAIDAGTRDGIVLTDRDLIGNPRVRGASVDTGPYEYDPSGRVETGVDDSETAHGFALHQNYPNPFNPNTRIAFSLSAPNHVRLVAYDLLGQEVGELVNRPMGAGIHESAFDASSLPSGVYIYVLEAGDRLLKRKMVLTK